MRREPEPVESTATRADSTAATRMNDGPKLEEWRRLRAQVKAEDRDDEPAVLVPPEAFADMRGTAHDRARFGIPTPAEETGPASAAIARRITKGCAGWRRPPTTREFFEAVRATDPSLAPVGRRDQLARRTGHPARRRHPQGLRWQSHSPRRGQLR